MPKRKKNRPNRQSQNPVIGWFIIGGVLLVVAVVILFIAFGQKPLAQPISQLTTEDFHSLAFSPTEAETIYFGHHQGLLVSKNGGKDWQPSTLTNPAADAMSLALPASNPKMMYVAGHDVFYTSSDTGKTWQAMKTNLPSMDIHGFAVDPNDANHVYAHVVEAGIYTSTDGGNKWTLLATPPASTFNLAVGENAETIFAATTENGFWRTTDGGTNWTRLKNIPGLGATNVAYSIASKQVYATTIGSGAGLYISSDNGESWEVLFKGIFFAVAVSPLNPNHLVIVNEKGQVYASRDNGKTWTDK